MTIYRHLYALYCLLQREFAAAEEAAVHPSDESDGSSSESGHSTPSALPTAKQLPSIFADPGWHKLNTSILSTSNCGNPALRLFGFGPVARDGFGIGYIIKDDAISM
jgi:carnitine O-acetyltransferase